jgi:hypothetical protein
MDDIVALSGTEGEIAWERAYDDAESVLVLAVLGYFYLLGVSYLAGLTGRELNLAVFLASLSVLPFACGTCQSLLPPSAKDQRRAQLVQFVNHWTLIPGLVALAATGAGVQMASAGAEVWRDLGYKVLLTTVAAHALAIGLSLLAQRRFPARDLLPRLAGHLARRSVQIASFTLAFFIAAVALFRIEPTSGYPSYVVRSVWNVGSPTQGSPLGAWPWAAGIVVSAVVLSRLDRPRRDAMDRRSGATSIALLALLLLFVLYFDFSLYSDPFHYLTNIGPALHLQHGGRLMVDTFSQYGPGPVVTTLAAFEWGTATFGSANLLVQAFNLSFYTLIVLCAVRIAGGRISAAWLTIMLVPAMLASWVWGQGNFNENPSALGFRFLPALVMVAALTYLKPPARRSWMTFLATCFAAAWSVEALVGALGIHLAFVTLLNFRQRAWARMPADWLFAALPAAVTIGLISVATRIGTGQWPDYITYLGFLKEYNSLSALWAVPADGLFWGWVPMILPLVLLLSDACARILRPGHQLLPIDDDALFYRVVPMGGLLAVTGDYFAGRAVEFTAVIAFLPFCALVVPAFLKTVDLCGRKRPVAIVVTLVPALAILWGLTVALAVLYREGSPYGFLVHECRDRGRCSPAALGQSLRESLSFRPWLDGGRSLWEPDDKHIVMDGVRLIERWAADQADPIVLLGRWTLDAGFSEAALMYTGKWHRWPRSMTLTDELNNRLLRRTLAAPVSLREGDVAIVRRDLDSLGVLERDIWDKVRAFGQLCELPGGSAEVVAYRLSKSASCEPVRSP